MTETAERYASVAAHFSERIRQVPAGADEQIRLIAFTGRTP